MLERDIPRQVREVAVAALGVASDHVLGGAEAGSSGRHVAQTTAGVGIIAPPHHHASEVGEHIAQGAEFPVEHCSDRAVVAGHAVVEAIVAVHDAGTLLVGDAARETGVQVMEQGEIAIGSLVDLALPAAKLAGAVVLRLAEIAESDGGRIKGVKVDERVDERLGEFGPEFLGIGMAVLVVEHDPAIDETHHVEVGPVDIGVLTQADGGRHRHTGALEGSDDPVFAGHVVR